MKKYFKKLIAYFFEVLNEAELAKINDESMSRDDESKSLDSIRCMKTTWFQD